MTVRDYIGRRRLMRIKGRGALASKALERVGLRKKSESVRMGSAYGIACGAMAAGAALTYVFDPVAGRRRRKMAGDKLRGSARQIGGATDVVARDLSHRTGGLFASLLSRLSSGRAPDNVIEDRVRARLGHFCSHPRAVAVEADDGNVTVWGPVLADELDDVLRAVWKTRGVNSVQNRLEPHSGADIPALQGGRRTRGGRRGLMRGNWSPATRFIAGTTGAALMTYCAARRTVPAAIAGTFGFALFVRSVIDLSARHTARAGGRGETSGASPDEQDILILEVEEVEDESGIGAGIGSTAQRTADRGGDI